MLVRWIRKDTLQLHDFDWEVSLMVPIPGGQRSGQGVSPHLVFGNARYPALFRTSTCVHLACPCIVVLYKAEWLVHNDS